MVMVKEAENILQEIITQCNPEKVILFGVKQNILTQAIKSLDFCIIVPDTGEKKQELLPKLYLAIESSVPFQLVIYTAREWTEMISDPTSHADAIQQKGTVLYEQKP